MPDYSMSEVEDLISRIYSPNVHCTGIRFSFLKTKILKIKVF